MPRRRERGLSLLEMLVVLVIAGMTLLLTTQAVGQYQRAQSSVLHSERAGREFRLTEAWWRRAVQGIQPFGEPAFEGDADGFRATTLSPVVGLPATPASQSWRIAFADDGGWALQLEEGGQALVLVFEQAGEPAFRYLDAEGEWLEQWPPALGEQTPLPEAVAIVWAGSEDGPARSLVAAINGAREPWYRTYEREADL